MLLKNLINQTYPMCILHAAIFIIIIIIISIFSLPELHSV